MAKSIIVELMSIDIGICKSAVCPEKNQKQLDLQVHHRVRSRLVSRRTATINQIRAWHYGAEGAACSKSSFETILEERKDVISLRKRSILIGLYGDWFWLDDRIDTVSREIELISHAEENCVIVMTIPGIDARISTAMVAAVETGEAVCRGRDFAPWVGLVSRQ